ncbi:hypothetical protein THRCLA_20797 [Thraustotheca clavata]|uniref:Uncharacterized protein n=1 Tax=Thraustotheca clavata TaxID=74557 RepID=A0A1W0A3C1_9STRA|nr:hypothetical protein THRCLA_20797 [Thraustotheca clavata]
MVTSFNNVAACWKPYQHSKMAPSLSREFKKFRDELEEQKYRNEFSQYRRPGRFRGYVLCQLIMEKNVEVALELLHTYDVIESPQSSQTMLFFKILGIG